MSENAETDDKTEEPTQKRLDDARKKGQVARSKELSTMLVTMVSAALFLSYGETMLKGIMAIMVDSLTIEREHIFDPEFAVKQFTHMAVQGLLVIVPVLVITLIAVMVAPALLGGWSFSIQSIAFKIDKLNPIKGMKKVFSMRSLVELFKAIAKFSLVAIVAAFVLQYYFPALTALSAQPIKVALADGAWMMAVSFLVVSCSLVIIAALDAPYQLWEHKRQLKMTKQEIKDEHKEAEGSPELKGKVRQKQQEISGQRMMDQVPTADVIVTNPTHYAVALKYDAVGMRAPQVLAKGVDVIALQIRKLGVQSDVPVLESPALARALYATTELGDEIPGGLYKAVAQVLTYVYQLKHWHEHGGEYPQAPEPEFDKDEFNY